MELYKVIAVLALAGMGFVVHSTLRLNALRKRLGVEKTMVNLRDWVVVRYPESHDPEEVRLVWTTWISCAVLFALVLLLLAVIPPDVLESLREVRVG